MNHECSPYKDDNIPVRSTEGLIYEDLTEQWRYALLIIWKWQLSIAMQVNIAIGMKLDDAISSI